MLMMKESFFFWLVISGEIQEKGDRECCVLTDVLDTADKGIKYLKNSACIFTGAIC